MLSTSRLDTLVRIWEVRMRSLASVLLTPLLACSATVPNVDPLAPDGPTADDAGTTMPPPPYGFQLTSPTVDINPGGEITYCYYFKTPNTTELAIQRWASHMTLGVHDMILYLTPNDQQPAGTMSPADCGIVKRAGGPIWTYAAQSADAEVALPGDDGSVSHNPIGQLVKAKQSGFLQIHYLNTGTTALHAHVELNAYAHPDGAQVTLAAPFVTFNLDISIMPGSQAQPATGMVNGSCQVPLDPTGKPLRFFGMTSHTYKQGKHTFVKDGVDMVLDTTDWEHPRTSSWPVTPFYTFKSGTLFYQCEYSNPNDRTILTGDNATMDELCMTISYFFPAPNGLGHFCSNSFMLY
jgi:hypothetical protein